MALFSTIIIQTQDFEMARGGGGPMHGTVVYHFFIGYALGHQNIVFEKVIDYNRICNL